MKLDYIEIGTSDFDTLLQSTDLTGFSIEPLKIYLDRLPNKSNNTKLNIAISDFNGKCDVYFVSPDDIEKFNLPDWIRGCNSIIHPHQSASKVLEELGLSEIYQKSSVDVMTWDTLIRSKNIIGVDYLKIDTEGHDCVIIKSILDSETNLLPKKIKFETNILTPESLIKETISLLENRGYHVIEQTEENTVVELSEHTIDKIIFSSDSKPEYIDFWEVNSKICAKKLRITPVLFHICDEETDFYWDTFGLVKKVKTVSGDNTGFESQIFRMFGTKYFMDEICLTNDIDMILFNKDFITNSLIDKNSITIFGSDAYDSKRPECIGVYSGPDRYAICYIAATGRIFDTILNTNVTFEEYYNRLVSLDKWFDTDEIYFGEMVNKTDVKVNKIERGYSSSFYTADRIEKHNFEDYNGFKLDLNGFINVKKFTDCHCARPYSRYKSQIDNLVNTILSEKSL